MHSATSVAVSSLRRRHFVPRCQGFERLHWILGSHEENLRLAWPHEWVAPKFTKLYDSFNIKTISFMTKLLTLLFSICLMCSRFSRGGLGGTRQSTATAQRWNCWRLTWTISSNWRLQIILHNAWSSYSRGMACPQIRGQAYRTLGGKSGGLQQTPYQINFKATAILALGLHVHGPSDHRRFSCHGTWGGQTRLCSSAL